MSASRIRTAALCLPLVASLLTPTSVAADDMLSVKDLLKEYDKDRDGELTRKEFRISYEVFRAIDVDKNDVLSKKELSKTGALQLIAAASSMDNKKLVSLDERTALVDIIGFDENHDGRISRKEFDRFVFALCDQDDDTVINLYEAKYLGMWGTFNATFRGDPVLVMQRFDSDGDGVIEAKEFKGAKDEFKLRDSNRDGGITADELEKRPSNGLQAYANFDADTLIEMFDKNGDGKLSVGEVPGGKSSPFGQSDRDNDGEVARDELDRILKYQQTRQFSAIDPSFIERFDLNGDHKVSRREFPGIDSIFQRLDRNGDGVVSKADG